MSNYNKYSKGSEWRKWDLHFHTPSSDDYENKSLTEDEIIQHLVSNQIEVVAITDHNFIDVERIKKLQEKGKGMITVLPGIELRSELGGSESVHFIAIFPENSDIESIWKTIEVQSSILEQKKSGKKDNEIYCDLKDTAKIVHQLGGLVSIHAGGKSNSIENITNTLPYKMVLKSDLVASSVDIFELGNVKDCSDYDNIVFPAIKKEYPMVICSDNHRVDNYKLKETLWIKADPTYEGLKQIRYEPKDRIKLQQNIPDEKDDIRIICRVRFINGKEKELFMEEWIDLNKNLNCIIGGKSSGKSLLLYLIAKTIDESEVDRRGIKPYKYEGDKSFDFEVEWCDGKVYSLKQNPNEKNRKITYIPQLYVINMVEGNKELRNLIYQFLKEDEEFVKDYDKHIKKVGELYGQLKNNISNLFNLFDKEETLSDEIQKEYGEEDLLKEISNKDKEIEELKKRSEINEEELSQYSELVRQKEEIIKNKNDYLVYHEAVDETSQFVERNCNEFIAVLQSKLELLTLSLEDVQLKEKLNSIVSKYIANINKSNAEFNLEIKKERDESIEKVGPGGTLDIELKNIEDKLLPYIEKFHEQEYLKELNSQKEIFSKKVKNLQDRKKLLGLNDIEIKNLEEKIILSYDEIIGEYDYFTSKINSIYNSKFHGDMRLISYINFNKEKFNEDFSEIFDRRTTKMDTTFSGFENELYVFKATTHISNLKTMLKMILNGDKKLNYKNYRNKRDAIENLFGNYFDIRFNIKYKGDDLFGMSPGKRSLILLYLYLALSNAIHPILIDQPEDNLDNRTVYKNLIHIVKQKKKERQIIIVTHNANLVVSTDAEEIIVANQMGQEDGENLKYDFEYVSGSLEHSFKDDTKDAILYKMGIRDHICDILEGGEDAFKEREQRYDFPKK